MDLVATRSILVSRHEAWTDEPEDTLSRTPEEWRHMVIWVCEDCLLADANGEEPEHPDQEPWGLIEDRATVSMGMLWEEHYSDCPNHLAREWVNECSCERLEFSWRACGACGSHLGGSRQAYTLWEEN